jgi:hypothetical protein
MGLEQFAPAAVIGAGIAITEMVKLIVPKATMDKIIWLPGLLVGILGAIFLGIGSKPWNLIAWDAICYAAASSYAVLIAKRTIKKADNE